MQTISTNSSRNEFRLASRLVPFSLSFSLDPCFLGIIQFLSSFLYETFGGKRIGWMDGWMDRIGRRADDDGYYSIERTSALSVAAVLNSRWNGFSSAGSFSIKLHLFLSLRNAPDASLISSYWRARHHSYR